MVHNFTINFWEIIMWLLCKNVETQLIRQVREASILCAAWLWLNYPMSSKFVSVKMARDVILRFYCNFVLTFLEVIVTESHLKSWIVDEDISTKAAHTI